jgi:hypothetical protein
MIPKVTIVSSAKAGLGKTLYVEKQAKGQTVHHFPIGGKINFKSLARRLKAIDFSGNEVLLIKIGLVTC